MQEEVFNYWATLIILVAFVCIFPIYIVKTKGRGLPFWGLSACVVVLFLFLPMLSLGFIRDVLPTLWLSVNEPSGPDAPSVQMLAGSLYKLARLDQVYVVLAILFILVSVGQSCMAAWMLYVRHNRESLIRAIRFMWCSGMMVVLATGVLPLVILRSHGFELVKQSWWVLTAYLVILAAITCYLRVRPEIAQFYPISHQAHSGKRK